MNCNIIFKDLPEDFEEGKRKVFCVNIVTQFKDQTYNIFDLFGNFECGTTDVHLCKVFFLLERSMNLLCKLKVNLLFFEIIFFISWRSARDITNFDKSKK